MSVTTCLYAMSDAELARIAREPAAIAELTRDRSRARVDLGKAAPGLAYLYDSMVKGAAIEIDALDLDGAPQHGDLGYRCVGSGTVAMIRENLEMAEDDRRDEWASLAAHYDPQAMRGIYPHVWERPEALEMLRDAFADLARFYRALPPGTGVLAIQSP